MLFEFENELGGDFVYWCGGAGDLNDDITDIAELPTELQRAYNELWSDDYWANCYIVEFNGKYGVAIESEYDRYFAEDVKMSYEELLDIAKRKAVECSEKYPDYDVIFGKDTMRWSDGSVNSTVSIIVPWNESVEKLDEVATWYDSMCYNVTH